MKVYIYPHHSSTTNERDQTMKSQSNFAEPIRVLLTMSQVFCAAPINLSIGPQKQSRKMWLRRSMRFAHLLWSVFILIVIAYCMQNNFTEIISSDNSSLLQILYLSELAFNLMNCVLVIVSTNYQQLWFNVYVEQINAINKKLQLPVTALNVKLSRFLRLIFTISFVFLTTVISIIVTYQKANVRRLLQVCATYVVTNIIIFLALLQFFVLVYVVQKQYEQLLITIRRMSNTLMASHVKTINIYHFEAESKMNCQKGLQFMECKDTTKERLEMLRSMYFDLTILEGNINQSFGVFIVSLVLSAFFVVTTQLYVFYTQTQDVDFMQVTYSSVWMIQHCLKVFAIFFLSSRVSQEVIIKTNHKDC